MKFGLGNLCRLRGIVSDSMLDIDTGLEKWKAQQVQTQSKPIDDPGIGQAIVIRGFKFVFKPETLRMIQEKKLPIPSKQELFNSVWPQIRLNLWGEGLMAIQEKGFEPKMKITKKMFVITLLCEPTLARKGDMKRKAKTLNEYLKSNG